MFSSPDPMYQTVTGEEVDMSRCARDGPHNTNRESRTFACDDEDACPRTRATC